MGGKSSKSKKPKNKARPISNPPFVENDGHSQAPYNPAHSPQTQTLPAIVNAHHQFQGQPTHSYQPNQVRGAVSLPHKQRQLPARPPSMFYKGATEGEANIYVALFSYNALNNDDLTFKKGDRFKIMEKGQGPWWIATALANDRQGYIPSNYVEEECHHSEDWFFGDINRREAERGLMVRGNEKGTFLIRESERFPGSYTLSLLDQDPKEGRVVKHFRIKAFDAGGFYISTKVKFENLQELVNHYKSQTHGLPTKLTVPCRKIKPMAPGITWETPRSSLKLKERLGDGQFGEVWKGIWNNRIAVAVKKMKEGSMLPSEFLKEAEIMKNLRHDHLLQLLAVCSDREPIYIVTELMCHGSLLDYLRDGEGKYLAERQLIDMLAQVASGMAYLEANNYIHRDLAARNVLVGESNLCKVADFGLTRLINGEYVARRDARFPVKWTAPEAATFQTFTIKSDIWSFGVLSFEIISRGQVPYAALGNQETLDRISSGWRMPKPHKCPEALYEVMMKCWEEEPKSRPTFEFLFSFLDSFGVAAEDAYQ
ncbi:tyrosine-protein kinase STK-like [Ptychodera flava]|uniref:tyrosine-protein kinase STK-like n=1 Tax=Ptychodera flava TaxID=63121 RepID=UPI00396A0234